MFNRSWMVPILFLVSFTAAGEAQVSPGVPTRDDRVVVHSPHFDTPPPRRGPLRCPPMALSLFGFEEPLSSESRSRLLVRVMRDLGDFPGDPFVEGALVHFTERLDGDEVASLPLREPWAALTDSDGQVYLEVPPGIYRVEIRRIGFEGGEGVVRLRAGARDSLHAYLDEVRLC
jgi:hypothetical protein